MDQVKITSFFNRIGRIDNGNNSSSSSKTSTNGIIAKSCDSKEYNPNYDSDTTIVYDYEKELKLTFSANNNSVVKPKGATSFADIFKLNSSVKNGLSCEPVCKAIKTKNVKSTDKSTKRTINKKNTKNVSENGENDEDSNQVQPRRSSRRKLPSLLKQQLESSSDSESDFDRSKKNTNNKKVKSSDLKEIVKTSKIGKKQRIKKSSSNPAFLSVKPPKGTTTNKENEIICIEDEDNISKVKVSEPLPPPPIPKLSHPPMKLWTQKYQPTLSSEFVGNCHQLNSAKEWLDTWGETFNSQNNAADDEDDRDDDELSSKINGKCLYLYGPAGVGKTSMVYSIAKECGYKVLEYNATSLRLTPALIQKELCESIQSYCIDKPNSILNFFGGNKKQISPPKPPSPPVQKKRGRKPKCPMSNVNNNNNTRISPKQKEQIKAKTQVKLSKSLILFDDLDAIIYENKSCYELWRLLKSIITDSRKPIVITSSLDSSFICSDLHYFNTLRLDLLPANSINKYLNRIYQMSKRQISETDSNENVVVEESCLSEDSMNLELLNFNGDLRRITNTVEFWSFNLFQDSQFLLNHHLIQDSEMSDFIVENGTDNQKHLDLIELISLENILQAQFDKCLLRDSDDNLYNSHLCDKRLSLLNTVNGPEPHLPAHCATICNRFYHLDKPKPSSIEEIQNFVSDNYERCAKAYNNSQHYNNCDKLDDRVSFFHSLIVDGGFSELLQEIDLMKKSKIISTRSKRNYSKFDVPSSLLF